MKKLALALAVGLTAVWTQGAATMIDRAHDRVQTTFDPQLDRIGTLRPRSAREVGRSHLAIGCEMLPRGYGDFESFKEYLPPLGIVRVRLHAGWAKLEPEPGKWDFTWLDRQVRQKPDLRGSAVLRCAGRADRTQAGARGRARSNRLVESRSLIKNHVLVKLSQIRLMLCLGLPCRGMKGKSCNDNRFV